MRWLWLIGIVVVPLGPLRPWVGRHWALLISVIAGALFGFVLGAFALATGGTDHSIVPLPLLWGLIGAIAVGRVGPAWLRHIEKDGKNERSPRRH